jgi:altronate dehydratase small subunit
MAHEMASAQTDRRVLILADQDNVAVATTALEAGEQIVVVGETLEIALPIAMGHKIALCPIAAGERVIKYGAPIGSATQAIAAGEHVHVHNLKSDYLPTFERGGGFRERT